MPQSSDRARVFRRHGSKGRVQGLTQDTARADVSEV
jgi:hypothetical protein